MPESRDTYASRNPIGQSTLAFPHEVRKPNRSTDIDSVRYIRIGQHSFHALDCTGSAAAPEMGPAGPGSAYYQHSSWITLAYPSEAANNSVRPPASSMCSWKRIQQTWLIDRGISFWVAITNARYAFSLPPVGLLR